MQNYTNIEKATSNPTTKENLKAGIKTSAGNAIGIIDGQTRARLYGLSVSLNIDNASQLPQFIELPKITWESPAIPAFVGKTLDLTSARIQLTKGGEYYPATDISFTWDTEYSGIKGLIIGQNKISTLKTGTYPLIATHKTNGESKKIYVIVNNENDYNFYLVNLDFVNNNSSFNLSDWVYAGKGYSEAQTAYTVKEWPNSGKGADAWDWKFPNCEQTTAQYGYLYNHPYSNVMFLYKAPILADFEDFTFITDIKFDNPDDDVSVRGVISKVQLDYNNLNVGDKLFGEGAASGTYMNQLKFGTGSFGSLGNPYYGSGGNRSFETYPIHSLSGEEWKTTLNGSQTADYSIVSNGSKRTVTIQYSGNDIVYKLDDNNTVLDTRNQVYKLSGIGSAATSNPVDYDTNILPSIQTAAGNAIGVFMGQGGIYLYKLQAKLNVDENSTFIPYTDLDIYTVDPEQPVIPMTAGYQVSFADFLITDASKNIVSAANAGFTTDASATDLVIEDGLIKAYKKGTYTITATDGTKLFVVVKNPEDTEYTVYENDYRSNLVDNGDGTYSNRSYADDFETTIFRSKEVVDSSVDADLTGATNYASVNGTQGFSPVTVDQIEANLTTLYDRFVKVYTVLENEAVASLKNYKATATVQGNQNSNDSLGLVGRITGYDKETFKLSNSTALFGFGTAGITNYSNLGPINTDTNMQLSKLATDKFFPTRPVAWSAAYDNKPHFQSYTIEFKGNEASFKSEHSDSIITTTCSERSGAFAFSFYFNPSNTKRSVLVPAVIDVKIVLNDVDLSKLASTKIAEPAEYKAPTGYLEIPGSYTAVQTDGALTGITANAVATLGEKFTVPATVGGVELTKIGTGEAAASENAFFAGLDISCYDFSQTNIKTLNAYAFANIRNQAVEQIILPETLKTVGDNAFASSYYVREVIFPNSVTSIGSNVFMGATDIEYVKYPDSLTSINWNVFRNSGLQKLDSAPLTIINPGAFQDCKQLISVNLSPDITKVGADAFVNAVNFAQDIYLGAKCTEIGNNAFKGTAVTKITILNKDATIGTTAFPVGATIYGFTGSTADAYVTANPDLSLTFVALDDVTQNAIPVNTRFNLTATSFKLDGKDTLVGGDTLVWTTDSALCEISGGYLNVYSAGTATVIGTSDAGTVTLNLTFAAAGTETQLIVEEFADENIAIGKDGNKYTFTVADTANLIPGSLEVTDAGSSVFEVDIVGESGNVFSASVYAPHTMQVSAQYAADENELLTNTYMIGNQIKSETGNNAIRFVSAIPAVRNGALEIDFIGDKVIVDEKPVTLDAVGTLLIPTAILGNDTEKLKIEKFDINKASIVIPGEIDTRKAAQNVVIKYLANATDEFSIANTTLNKIPDSYKALDISCVTYLHYEDDEGNQGFIYSNILTASYNEIQEKLYPAFDADKISTLMYGGTDHELDSDPNTDAISYGLNEDITFSVKAAGAYTMTYTMQKDDVLNNLAEGELQGTVTNEWYGQEKTKVVGAKEVNSGNYLEVTTQRKTAGSVRLVVNFYGADKTKSVKTVTMTALAGADQIKQPIEYGEENREALVAATKGYFDSWTATWDAQFDTLKALTNEADQTAAQWVGDTANRQVGDTFTAKIGETEVIKITAAIKNDAYVSYTFYLSTDNTIGTQSNAFGNKVFAYPEFNKRPSTGVLSVPLSGTGGIIGHYKGFGNSVSNAENWDFRDGKIHVDMNSHGVNPTEVISDNSTIATTATAGGGLSDVMTQMSASENPAELYQYGILYRDYIALQFAKELTAWNGADIRTSGGSMGAWQSISLAALDADVNATNASIPWMCHMGWHENDYIMSGFMPNYNVASEVFSSVTAAHIINDRAESAQKLFTFKIDPAGLGDYNASPPTGVMALYNAFESDYVDSYIKLMQFYGHGDNYQGDLKFDAIRHKPANIAQ